MPKKKIAIIGTVGIPAQYGGFETLSEHLATHLSKEFDIHIYCSGKVYEEKNESHNGATLHYLNLDANGISSIPYDAMSMFQAIRYAEVLVILGVSGCMFLPFVRLFFDKTIILNIDGLEWKREKWGRFASWFLKKSERVGVYFSDSLVSDNKVIQDYLVSEYGRNSFCIAYGGDHVFRPVSESKERVDYPFIEKKYAFKVCRIEPENNIEMILSAFSDSPKLPLVLVGNWKSSGYGKCLRAKYERNRSLFLLDPIYDQAELNRLRSHSTVYVHGHSAGGTNPSLVEAMSLGLPIFAFDVAYNRETTEGKAVYFGDSRTLKRNLVDVSVEELKVIGEDMTEVASRRYRWVVIVDEYRKLFLA